MFDKFKLLISVLFVLLLFMLLWVASDLWNKFFEYLFFDALKMKRDTFLGSFIPPLTITLVLVISVATYFKGNVKSLLQL